MSDGDDQGSKRRGRPAGKRGTFSFRVTADLRSKLEADAEKSGRPVSEEIEKRLEESYKLQEILKITHEEAWNSATKMWVSFRNNSVGGAFNDCIGLQFASVLHGFQINSDNLGGDRNWTRDRTKALIEEKGASEMIPALLAHFPFPPDTSPHPEDVRREEERERTKKLYEQKAMQKTQG